MLGAELSPLAAGEQPLALKLLPRLRRGDLVLADRNFLSHGLLSAFTGAGVHVLWRAKGDTVLPVLEVLPDGTYLSRIADPAASRRMRRKGARPGDIPGIAVRVIEYSVTSDDGDRGLRDLHPGHRHHRSRRAVRGAGRGCLFAPLGTGDLFR